MSLKPRLLLPLLLSLGLWTPAQAMPNAESEAALQKAMDIAKDNQQRLEQLLEQEQEQQLQKPALAQAMQQITRNAQVYESQLHKASDAGHGVASYLLANLEENRKTLSGHDYQAQHNKACALYQSAADQGLLAAAVILLRDCETAYQRFELNDPELLRLRAQLLKALEQADSYAKHYPLPAINSFCFKPAQMPEIKQGQPLATLKSLYTPVLLNLEQFRADGYYLLALKSSPDGSAARDYFYKVRALAADCLDPISLGSMLDAAEQKAPGL